MRKVVHLSSLPYYTLSDRVRAGMPSLPKLVLEFARRGWQTTFVFLSWGEGRVRSEEGVRFVPIPGAWYHGRANRGGWLQSLVSVAFAPAALCVLVIAAWRMVRRCQPHLVYCHGSLATIAGAFVARRLRIPVVARFYGFSRPGSLLNKSFASLDGLRTWPDRLALASQADLNVVTDDGTRGHAVMTHFGLEDRSMVLRNGIDVPANLPGQSAAKRILQLGDEPVVTYVGRLETWKKPHRLVQCAAEAKRQGLDWQFVVVGSGKDRPDLEAAALRMGVEDRIDFTGPVPHELVWMYLAASDVFLTLHDLTSVTNTLLEAAALGVPIVCSDVGNGLNDVVRDGENGFALKDVEDMTAVVRAVEAALKIGRAPENIGWSWQERLQVEFDRIESLAAGSEL